MAIESINESVDMPFMDLNIQLPLSVETKTKQTSKIRQDKKLYSYIRKGKTCYRSTPPRPMNAFILYRRQMHAKLQQESPLMTMAEISKAISKMWKEEQDAVKKAFCTEAMKLRAQHAQLYPDFRYQAGRRKRADTIGKSANIKPVLSSKMPSNFVNILKQSAPLTEHDIKYSSFAENIAPSLLTPTLSKQLLGRKPATVHNLPTPTEEHSGIWSNFSANSYTPTRSKARATTPTSDLRLTAQEIADGYKQFCDNFQSSFMLAVSTDSILGTLSKLNLQKTQTPAEILAENGQTYTYAAENDTCSYPFLPVVGLQSIGKSHKGFLPQTLTSTIKLDPFMDAHETFETDKDLEALLRYS